MSKIAVAVLNRKGGVGKTTVAVILAEIALVRHNRVLA
ncbi:MAG: AAA family ATPase, partial [Synergistaceae bacterium]|nr:AAA family ATPase [Synergistaceae bacterium]